MEERRHPYFVLFVFHLAIAFVQGYNLTPTAVIPSSNGDSMMDINPTKVTGYGPCNARLTYKGNEAPIAVNITEKTSPVFTCTADCSPPCNITWYKDGKTIESNGKNKDLKINRIVKTHSGTYKCQASGVAGKKSFSSELKVTVHYGPRNARLTYKGNEAPIAVNITEKTSPVLTCTADCSPPCNITWYKDGKTIESNGKNKDLKINRIAKIHSGTYKCQASGVAGKTSFSSELKVTVHYGPNNVAIQYTNDRKELWEGRGEITITCNADCNPRCNYWMRHNGRNVSTENTYTFTMDRKNSGEYSCAARNSVSTSASFSKTITLDIKYGPSNVSIQYTSDREELWEGSGKITITCNADCNPRCNYTIQRDGSWLSSGKTEVLTLNRKNSGQYSCTARNAVHRTNVKSSKRVRLHIKYRTVRLSSIKKNITLEVNHNLPSNVVCTIDCNYGGCGSSTITVLRNSEVYNTMYTNQSIFQRRQALLSDDGMYKCKLSDNIESAENFQLVIFYGPRNVSIREDWRNADAEIVLRERSYGTWLSCSADCNPACKISWYKNGQLLSQRNKAVYITSNRRESGNYKCVASGVEGTVSSNQVKITIQYGPKNVTIQYTSDTEELWEGSGTITITCNADCNPQCNYHIYRDGGWFYTGKTKVLAMDRKNSGNYICTSKNSVITTYTTSSNTIRLDIKYGPKNVKIMKGGGNADAEIVLREGDSGTRLTCSSDCNPACNISWYQERKVLFHQRDRTTISITSNRRNSGNYKCVANGIKGTVSSKQVKITVQYSPTTVKVMPDSNVYYSNRGGRPLENITCQADCLPECTYTWKMENPYWPDTIFNTGDTLFANRNFTYNDSRRFKCAATNDVGERESRWITVEMKKGPDSVRITTKPPRGRQHEPFEMECSATCNNGCLSYSWFHERKLIYREELLHFNNLSKTDNGVYTCTASDYVGTTSTSYNLNVQYGPVNVSIQNTSDGNNLIEKQGYVNLTCHADCNPPCSYMFYHNDKRKQNRFPGDIYKTKENSGRYSCSATNYVADTPTNSSNSVDIYIQYKPRLTVSNFPRIAAPGSLKLNFSVDSFPASNVTIFHNEKLDFFPNFTGDKTYKINISSCLDEGKYRIVAENIVGKQSTSKTLTVQCAPIIITSSNTTNKGFEIGDALNLTVKFMAKPSPNASWTFFSKEDVRKGVPKIPTATGKGFTSIIVSHMSVHDFGTYQLTLNNKFGRNETEFNIQGPPHPPTELTVNCSNTVLIQWKPGFDGGSDQRFVIEYTTNVSSSWLSHNPHPVTSDNVGHLSAYIHFLQPYVPYFFRIVAENRFGSRRSGSTAKCTIQGIFFNLTTHFFSKNFNVEGKYPKKYSKLSKVNSG
ncbi:hemicentin-1-like [Ostrea edulis]|uniref:hemicentin-1-like n=1 Tax=Ostrea edulis TaxID=37623 RepID=UPI0024AF0DC8|nr:hemicentin-1-like [Ostrea edulis]XP_056012165.1 hemicentin-1-like [Ostrea edulis]XP_056012166.1 hemicentin-1-like [Ostrea edulis]XP_056012167.1 hemicentin-1-like [Ostrea edulis]